jgi:hypothetical protein
MFGGLFGKKKQMPMPGVISGYGGGTFDVDGTPATPPVTMDMIPTTAGGRYGDPMPQQQDQRGGFLKPYGTGQLIFSALSDLGAAINDRQGGALAGMTQDMMMQRERAAKQAEALRMQAETMAAAQRLGISPDQAMLLGDNVGSVIAAQMKPETPPAIQQNADYIRRTQGDAAADEYIRNFGRPQQTPVMMEIGGRPVFGTPEQIQSLLQSGALGGQVQAPAVSQSDWDSAKPMGGSGGNVGGGFRG